MVFSLQERIAIVEAYLSSGSIKKTRDTFTHKFPNSKVPACSSVQDLVRKWHTTGSVANAKRNKPATVRTPVVVADIEARISRNPRSSARKLSQEVNVSRTTCRRVLKSLSLSRRIQRKAMSSVISCDGDSSKVTDHPNSSTAPNQLTSTVRDKLYIETPVLHSFPLSDLTGMKVYLKLDNLQPPGSFKMRGISHLIQKAAQNGTCEHVYCASGGNAGLAAAFASKQLGIPCTIILPVTTPAFVADSLKVLDAEVRVHGEVYDEAKNLALELSKQCGSLYVPAFEHPDIWEGHSSMIVEAARQMQVKPDVVVVSVGGGGLLNGVIQGMRQVGWDDVPVVAMETHGAHSFDAAIKAGEVVTLPAITSVAKTLGALSVTPSILEYYKEAKPPIINCLVTDKEAVSACVKFSDDHRFLVEPACGASLAAIYSEVILRLKEEGKLTKASSVLVIVCGGAIVSSSVMEAWKLQYQL
ncbi:unnamed protein product [Lymnaea stagnalis]|uniref:L-serine ammonia-lyase n=1 Tax=Lymnaea stagnalis TaxID=6523 RepID=A0AAV2HYH4_LYMST